jgi:putative hydrolase
VILVDPAEALRKVAYLLERQQAETYKVRAFRRAAAAVDAVERKRLEELARIGRLTDLDGVGRTTAAVVSEALQGEVPSYLRQLEAVPVEPLDEEAARLLTALRGDCHCHSDWSDGGSPIDEMAQAARALGREYMVLTDHSPRLTVAHGLDAARLLAQLEVLEELNAEMAPFRILSGIEVDILEDGTLDQSAELLGRLDVVVASVHSKLRMEAIGMTRRMVRAVSDPNVDILGHCTGRILAGRGRPQSTFDAEEVFAACAETGTALEVNSRPERRDPPAELLELAVDAGCVFTIDSDAHAPGQLEWLQIGCRQAADAGIGADMVMNTRGAADLLEWASH